MLKYIWILDLLQDTPATKTKGIIKQKMEQSFWLLKLGYGHIRL